MVRPPVSEIEKDFLRYGSLIAHRIQTENSRFLAKDRVLLLMTQELRVSVLCEELLLRLEVLLRVLGHSRQGLRDRLGTNVRLDVLDKQIYHVNDSLVLLIEFCNVDTERLIPAYLLHVLTPLLKLARQGE